MRVSSVRISTRSLRSRLVSGSSMRNARGSRTSARPSATRCMLAARHLRRACAGAGARCAAAGHLPHPLVDLGLAQPAGPQRGGDVVRGRLLRVERVGLEHHRQVALGGRGPGRVDPGQVHGAVVGLLEPRDHAQRRRLARPGRAEQHEERALRDVEVQIPQGVHVAEGLPDAGRDDRARSSADHLLGLGVVDRGRGPLVAHGDRPASSASRTVGGMRTFSSPASVSTT